MKKEYLFAILIAVSVLVLTNLTYFVPLLTPKSGLVFLDRRPINSEDVYTNLSIIEQVRQGRILVENQYTSEPQTASILRPSYILIGLTARFINISSVAAYNLFRIIFSIVFFFVLYKFLFLFFDEPKKRLAAFAIILTSSGLGFALFKIFPASIDLWIPEAVTFLALMEAPQFILGLILLLTGYCLFIKYLRTKNMRLLVPMFTAFLLLSFEHPFDIFVIVPVLFITALWNKLSPLKSYLIALFSGIGLIYQVVATYQNPILKAWNAQNVLSSPSPVNYLVGFGFLIALGLIGIELFTREQKPEQKLAIVWIGVTALLIYAPINFQRRFIEGVHIPLSIAATFGIFILIKKLISKHPKIAFFKEKVLLPAIILVLSFSSIFVIYDSFRVFGGDNTNNYYYYLQPQEIEAIHWLGSQTNFNDVIFSNVFYGNLIPGLTGRKVYIGDQIQTINLQEKIASANAFLLEANTGWDTGFLKQNNITYIFLGVNDSMLSYGFKPDARPYLTKVYDSGGVLIYKVNTH